MTDATIARFDAAQLNPLISTVGLPDTISQCTQMLDAIGFFFGSEEGACLPAHLFTGAISAALRYEMEVAHA